jgi:TetR/AcrR family transcriptional repressor of nem operon
LRIDDSDIVATAERNEATVKVSKAKAAENRAALIEAAARLFCERGIDGVGVAEISKEAGLTHGALYAQFPSKEALAAEALTHGLERGHDWLAAIRDDATPRLSEFLDFYLSKQHGDNLAGGCVMAALASEIARQDKSICARFAEGFALMVSGLEAALGPALPAADRRPRAIAVASAMIGGIAVARATAKAQPALSDEIRAAVRSVLGELTRAAPAPSPPARRGTARAPRGSARPPAARTTGRRAARAR